MLLKKVNINNYCGFFENHFIKTIICENRSQNSQKQKLFDCNYLFLALIIKVIILSPLRKQAK